MPAPDRHSPRARKLADDLPDFGAVSLGPNPKQTMRVLGMVRAGHTLRHIIEVGRYQGAWTEADVRRILVANRVIVPAPDRLHSNSVRLTAATTVVLPARQVQVLHSVCQGMTNAEIAAALELPLDTVKSQVSAILKATGCRDRIAVVVAVLNDRIVPVIEGTQ